jgi:hypothetical protein
MAVARLTLLKALSTSLWPVVNANPMARKPMIGMTVIVVMRKRTENLETSCFGEMMREVSVAHLNWPTT